MDPRAVKLRENLLPALKPIASSFGRELNDILLYIRYKVERDVFWFDYPVSTPQEMSFQSTLTDAIRNASIGTGFKDAVLDVPENREMMEQKDQIS